MLFNSYAFIFLFLPITAAVFFALGRSSPRMAAASLALASLFFYGYWNPVYVFLLIGSIAFNFWAGVYLMRHAKSAAGRTILTASVAANLVLLGYFKYANFFVDNLNSTLGVGVALDPIILPLGISFFTFTQIAFLVDAYRGEVREYSPIHYLLFVTYFPHLIAGPVLHHKEMMPQFKLPKTYRWSNENFAVGMTMFVIGLSKKMLIADNVAVYASPVFTAAANGEALSFFEAWGGALAYTLQIYFDFSGYSDMAIGLSRMFGVTLPLNFNSPYKAINIIEFWRRWHMTLSRFLRDYLYFALGGNRRGPTRRYTNLALTMLLGGLWHGAGWTFVAWGALHGLYLVINHGWRALKQCLGWRLRSGPLGRFASWALTFLAVVVAWVFFRAESFHSAMVILGAMSGAGGIVLPQQVALVPGTEMLFRPLGFAFGPTGPLFQWPEQVVLISVFLLVAWLFPNSQQLLRRYRPALETPDDPGVWGQLLEWRPNAWWAVGSGTAFAACVLNLNKITEFLYFQF